MHLDIEHDSFVVLNPCNN